VQKCPPTLSRLADHLLVFFFEPDWPALLSDVALLSIFLSRKRELSGIVPNIIDLGAGGEGFEREKRKKVRERAPLHEY